MVRVFLKVVFVVAIALGAFFAGYVAGIFDQESATAWREASITTSSLRALRDGKVDAAILLLETRLDTQLLQYYASEHGIFGGLAQQLRPFPKKVKREAMGYAAQYRLAYPSPAADSNAREQMRHVAEHYQ